MQFPGSLRLTTTTFLTVFREVCDSLAQHGFEHLIAVNGHGGNNAALTVAVNHTKETTGRSVFLVQWWDLAADVLAEIEGPLLHAEEAEADGEHRLNSVARDHLRSRPRHRVFSVARRCMRVDNTRAWVAPQIKAIAVNSKAMVWR
jgi:creatinine amidohydrolase/Fe(II)-dependent formamide hydrolase-like protein